MWIVGPCVTQDFSKSAKCRTFKLIIYARKYVKINEKNENELAPILARLEHMINL